MSLTGHITRDELSLDDLELFVPGDLPADQTIPRIDFVIDGLTPGGWVKRRQIAESQYMDDAVQVQSSKARVPGTFAFFVTGYDADSLQAAATELITAVDQSTWRLNVNMSGSGGIWGWECWDAEPTPGFPVETWHGLLMPITVVTLRSPVPVSGPI